MRKFFITLLFLQIVLSLDAQGKMSINEEMQMKRAAFKYREDINPRIISGMDKLPKVPILHSKWIDNPNGKSLWTDGTEMFPDIDYLYISNCYPNFYKLAKNIHFNGVFHADGTMIVPMEYEYITVVKEGYFKCSKPLGVENNKFKHYFDLYDFSGKKIISLSYLTQDRLYGTSCDYDAVNNLLKINYKSENNKKYIHCLYYPDGQLAFGPFEDKSNLLYIKNGSVVSPSDKKHTYPIENFNPQGHSTLGVSVEGQLALLSNEYKDNIWIQKAINCYHNEQWQDALMYMNYFFKFDYNSEMKYTAEAQAFVLMFVRCKYELGQNQELYDMFKDNINSGLFSLGISYYYGDLPTVETKRLNKEAKDIYEQWRNLYKEAVQPILDDIKAKEDMQRIDKLQRQQRNMQIWAQFLTAIGTTLNNYLSYSSSSSQSSVGNTSNNAVSPHSSSTITNTSSSSSGGGELVTQEKHTPCQVCNGTGKCTHCNGTGRGKKLGMDVTCGACSGHPTCSSCKGRGYKITYENVRK